MNKLYPFFIVLLVGVFMVGCNSIVEIVKPEPEQKTTEQIKKSVVRIRAENEMTGEKQEGTGFVVGVSDDKAYIMTVSHVVEGDSKPMVEFFENENKNYHATVLESEAELDNESQKIGLALLLVEKKVPYDILPLYLSKKRDLKLKDKFFTVGFPQGGVRWSHDPLHYSGKKKRNILFSGNINNGNSGSPIIKEDKVVAVITSITKTNHAVSTSAVSIREFLEGSEDENKILSEMEKWDIATWRTEYEARLELEKKKQTQILNVASTSVSTSHYVALVIGNANYSIEPLPNSINDAKDIDKTLKNLGFNVIYVENASQQTMKETIRTFMQTLSENSIGLFYYSGHEIQYEGKNYLIPIDANTYYRLNRDELVSVKYVIAEMDKAKTQRIIVFLDTSYSNPLGSSKYIKRRLGKIINLPGVLKSLTLLHRTK